MSIHPFYWPEKSYLHDYHHRGDWLLCPKWNRKRCEGEAFADHVTTHLLSLNVFFRWIGTDLFRELSFGKQHDVFTSGLVISIWSNLLSWVVILHTTQSLLFDLSLDFPFDDGDEQHSDIESNVKSNNSLMLCRKTNSWLIEDSKRLNTNMKRIGGRICWYQMKSAGNRQHSMFFFINWVWMLKISSYFSWLQSLWCFKFQTEFEIDKNTTDFHKKRRN